MRRKTIYIYDRADWPRFRWDAEALAARLGAVRHRQGQLLGKMASLGFAVAEEASLRTLTEEALKTSEIEGEILDRGEVRSSLARRLGLETAGVKPLDRRADAIASVVLDATQNYAQPLTVERLRGWHVALFPDGGGGRHPIRVGLWRDDALGPMQVVSNAFGRETIHFQAPAAARIPDEMHRFLEWFENGSDAVDAVIKAAVAHIWFVTIHPFDDGNGRIGRAVADLALARADGTGQRFFSLSAQLRAERPSYYATLEATQKGDLDITKRLDWFLGEIDRALSSAEASLAATLRKGQLLARANAFPLNQRQRMMLHRLLDDFVGKLTSSKWATIAKCSQDTALRDIDGLLGFGLLARDTTGGRSTSYRLSD